MTRKTAAAMKPGFGRTLDLPFAEAIRRAEQALAHQGFGILTRIDIRATLEEKLGVDHPPHVILGACNPSLAHRALETEPEVALLLPCNVVLRQLPDGKVRVEVADPAVMAALFPGRDLEAIVREAAERLKRALAEL